MYTDYKDIWNRNKSIGFVGKVILATLCQFKQGKGNDPSLTQEQLGALLNTLLIPSQKSKVMMNCCSI